MNTTLLINNSSLHSINIILTSATIQLQQFGLVISEEGGIIGSRKSLKP